MSGTTAQRSDVTPKRPLDGTHVGQRRHRDVEQIAQLVAPSADRRCRTASCGWRSSGRWRTPRRRSGSRAARRRSCRGRDRPTTVDRTLRQQPLELGAAEVRVEHRARCARGRDRGAPAPASSSQRAAVRRSCHTIASAYGSPVVRFQATTVSRWLVMPIAATCVGADAGRRRRRASPSPPSRSRRRRARPSPGCGKYCVNSRYAATVGRPSANTARLRTPVVPASIAITHVRLVTAVTVSAGRRRVQRRRLPGRFARPPRRTSRRVGAGR